MDNNPNLGGQYLRDSLSHSDEEIETNEDVQNGKMDIEKEDDGYKPRSHLPWVWPLSGPFMVIRYKQVYIYIILLTLIFFLIN